MSEPKQSAFSDNAAGALAWITFLPAIAFLVLAPYKKNSFVRYHAWQSILLAFFTFAVICLVDFVTIHLGWKAQVLSIPIVWAINVLWLLIWSFCALRVVNKKSVRLPLLGAFAEKQANS